VGCEVKEIDFAPSCSPLLTKKGVGGVLDGHTL